MVRKGNPRQRDWVGNNRTKLQRAVYASSDVCWLCGKPVDWDAPARSKWAPSVDHVLPRSRGGDPFSLANGRLAHYGCNAARGNRAPRPYVSQAAAFPVRGW